MHVTILTDYLLCGGVSVFIRNLSIGLAATGAVRPLDIIVLEESEDRIAAEIPCGNVYRLDRWMRGNIREDRLLEAYRILSASHSRIVIAALGMWSFEVLRLLPSGAKRVGMIQSDDPRVYEMVAHYRNTLDFLVGVSPEICRRAREAVGFSPFKIAHIPYGIPFQNAPRVAESPKVLRLIYLGRLIEEQKRVSRLIALVHALHATEISFAFTIAGDGPEAGFLQQELQHYSEVRFAGFVPQANLPQLLVQQDICILLSDYEGMPLSLVEAMGYGIVPLVSDLPTTRAWLPAHIGFFSAPDDISAQIAVLREVFLDRGSLALRSSAAEAFARLNYSADTMAKMYLDLNDNSGTPRYTALPIVEKPLPFRKCLRWSPSLRPARRVLRGLL